MVHNFVPWMHLCIRFSPTRGQTFQEQKFMYSIHPSLLSTPKQAFAQMEGMRRVRGKARTARRKVRESGDEGGSGFSGARGTEERCWDTPASLSAPELKKQTSRVWKLSRGDLPFWNLLAREQLRGQTPSLSQGRSRSTGVGVQKTLHLALKAWRRG